MFADDATAVRTRCVLSVIEATVPIVKFPEVFIIFPTLISVKKRVLVPVITDDEVVVVMVPVLVVFGQALALQLPEAALVIFAA